MRELVNNFQRLIDGKRLNQMFFQAAEKRRQSLAEADILLNPYAIVAPIKGGLLEKPQPEMRLGKRDRKELDVLTTTLEQMVWIFDMRVVQLAGPRGSGVSTILGDLELWAQRNRPKLTIIKISGDDENPTNQLREQFEFAIQEKEKVGAEDEAFASDAGCLVLLDDVPNSLLSNTSPFAQEIVRFYEQGRSVFMLVVVGGQTISLIRHPEIRRKIGQKIHLSPLRGVDIPIPEMEAHQEAILQLGGGDPGLMQRALELSSEFPPEQVGVHNFELVRRLFLFALKQYGQDDVFSVV